MATYYVTMIVETGDEENETPTEEVEQVIRDAVTADGWVVMNLSVHPAGGARG